jgi:hypothetical protein
MSAFSNSLGASRACADFRDPTAVSSPSFVKTGEFHQFLTFFQDNFL